MTRFHKVISLGPSCETAYQIRQVIDQEEAYVFDWVIASAPTVSRAIANGFTEIVGPEHLSLEGADEKSNHPFIRDSLTGIDYHHDFRNDPTFMETFEDVRKKYAYLKRRMIELLSSEATILFVHQQGTHDEVRSMAQAISTRYPNLSFMLLAITVGKVMPLVTENRIAYGSILGHGQTWQERTPQWAELLDKVLGDSYGNTLVRRDLSAKDAA